MDPTRREDNGAAAAVTAGVHSRSGMSFYSAQRLKKERTEIRYLDWKAGTVTSGAVSRSPSHAPTD